MHRGIDDCTAVRTAAQFQPRLLKGTLTAMSTLSGSSHTPAILTIQPCHAGVMNFELFTLKILHGEMGSE